MVKYESQAREGCGQWCRTLSYEYDMLERVPYFALLRQQVLAHMETGSGRTYVLTMLVTKIYRRQAF